MFVVGSPVDKEQVGALPERDGAPADRPGHRRDAAYCTTDHTNVAVPDTPFVSVAVTVTV